MLQQANLNSLLRDTVKAARGLLGWVLCRESARGLVSGVIVETEAYLSENDPACHASRGKTRRNAAMFGPPGRAYVYLVYGLHHCFNVVTGREGRGEAVLIRAVEPLQGMELMRLRRGDNVKVEKLACGPGNLCRAFAIDRSLDNHDLQNKPLYLKNDPFYRVADNRVGRAGRVGISCARNLPLRFYVRDNKYLSR